MQEYTILVPTNSVCTIFVSFKTSNLRIVRMLKKSELRIIADRLNWDIKETEQAVIELLDYPSLVDIEGFLMICASAKNPKDRWKKIIEFLLSTLEGDLTKTVIILVKGDTCFSCVAKFNFYDLKNSHVIKPVKNKKLPRLHHQRSFICTHSSEIAVIPNWVKHDVRSDRLSHQFVDIFISDRYRKFAQNYDPSEFLNPRDLLIEVIGKVGLSAFNVGYFRDLATSLGYGPSYDSFVRKLHQALIHPFVNRNEITLHKYWLIYVLVEKLRERGFGLRESFRKAARMLDQETSSIHTRYFERKKEVKEHNLKLKEIIEQFHLTSPVTDLLTKHS